MTKNEETGLELQLIEMRKRLLQRVDSAEEALREDVVKSGQISSVPTHAGDADVEGFDAQVAISLNEECFLSRLKQRQLSGFRRELMAFVSNVDTKLPWSV